MQDHVPSGSGPEDAAAAELRGGRAGVAALWETRTAVGSGWTAARAATVMAVALLTLWSAGCLELALYASFGAFASVYGGATRTSRRWRVQGSLGLLLSAAVVSGTLIALSPARSWLVVPIAAGWAALAAHLSDRFAWRPPGPMFIVFAVATCAAIPTEPGDLAPAAAATVFAAALAVLLGAAEVTLAKRFGWRSIPAVPRTAAPQRHRQRIQMIRCAVAVAVAGTIATTSGVGHPWWAMVAAVVPLAAFTFQDQLVRAVHRLAGTVLGLVIAGGLLLLELPTLAVIIVVVVLQALTELTVPRHYGLALVFITPLALLLVQMAHPLPITELLSDRLIETLIGVAVGATAAAVTRAKPSTLA